MTDTVKSGSHTFQVENFQGPRVKVQLADEGPGACALLTASQLRALADELEKIR